MFIHNKKSAIHNFLKGNALYNGQNYRLILAQDTIDRIVI